MNSRFPAMPPEINFFSVETLCMDDLPHTLGPGEDVHVFWAHLSRFCGEINNLTSFLDENECMRANRFRFKKDQVRYVLSHGILRMILARYLGSLPNRIELETRKRGKPVLLNPKGSNNLSFNLSHSHELMAVAISSVYDVGVDVEQIRYFPEFKSIARSNFHPDETLFLDRMPEHRKLNGFFQLWTQKEAVVKATGMGLYCPLNSFSIPGLSGGFFTMPSDCDRDGYDIGFSVPFECISEYAGALALVISDRSSPK